MPFLSTYRSARVLTGFTNDSSHANRVTKHPTQPPNVPQRNHNTDSLRDHSRPRRSHSARSRCHEFDVLQRRASPCCRKHNRFSDIAIRCSTVQQRRESPRSCMTNSHLQSEVAQQHRLSDLSSFIVASVCSEFSGCHESPNQCAKKRHPCAARCQSTHRFALWPRRRNGHLPQSWLTGR